MGKVNPEARGNHTVHAGTAVYSKLVLSIYDLYVLGFSNTFAWQCPSRLILDFYNEHVTLHHLDVGVGTGYFLDKCTFPGSQPRIALADLNENSLQTTARRLARYGLTTHRVNALAPLPIAPAGFTSVALNYLLHCLPGDLRSKEVVFRHVKPLLHDGGGVVFGTTILGQGVPHNRLGGTLMRMYNAKGIFGNAEDRAADLERLLRNNFHAYSLHVKGCVAFFAGRT